MKSSITIVLVISLFIVGTAGADDLFGDVNDTVTALTLTDCNGTAVTFTLTGGGWGEVIGGGNFDEINLYDTGAASNLFIKTASRMETSVGDIIVNGDLKSLVGKAVDLRGDITVTGTIGKLVLDDVADDHTITIESAGDGVSIKFDQVRDLTLDSNTPIKSLTATEWIDSNGSAADEIIAPSIDYMRVKGDRRRGIAGDFDADLLLTGAIDANKPTLKNGRIAGALNGAWEIDGDAGNLKMNQLRGDLEVYGDARNISTTDPLAITAGDPCLGELYVDGYSRIKGYKDRIKGTACALYSRSEPQLYPVLDLCDYYDAGSWWDYLVSYVGRAEGQSESGQQTVHVAITSVDGNSVVVTSSVAGEDVSFSYCADTNGTYVTAWDVDTGDMGFSIDIHNTMVAPEDLRMRQTYRGTGTFDGSFSIYVYGHWFYGDMSGTAVVTERLMGHEEVATQVDGGTTYMAAKFCETLKLTGVINLDVEGTNIRFGFSATSTQYSWGVPGVGLVKLTVPGEKVRISHGGHSTSVSMKEWGELTDYGPR
jgi:hypothetical protein